MKSIATNDALQRITANRLTVILSTLLLLVITLALITFIYVAQWELHDKGYLNRAGEQRVLSQQIAKYALAAASGKKEAFRQLEASRNRFDEILQELKNGIPGKLPASPKDINDILADVESQWRILRENADEILSGENPITSVGEWVNVITELMPQLQDTAASVAKVLVKQGADPRQVYIATRQLMLAQRIQNNVNQVLAASNVETEQSVEQFKRDSDLFGRVLEGMFKGDEKLKITKVEGPAERRLGDVAMLFVTIHDHAEEIIQTTPKVIPVLRAAVKSTEVSDSLDQATKELIVAYGTSPGRLSIGPMKVGTNLIIILGGFALLLLVILGIHLLFESRRRERVSDEMNQRNQKAILRLMDEMDALADGDLTVHCTVTEDDTGAIADAINNAIETLRRLVKTINTTSEQVSASAQETRATAMHLADATEHQAQQISGASQAIQQMADSIDQVSQDATDTAQVAQQSLITANKGADKVRSTINGMDSIREQIQETSKRIKRLGESSQEIGDIVELIDDIADQTNILALNAAMQAAMAGEAGRGFAVVADEVQRLAERSGNATKQIEALVKTIQADTNEAVSSMELSTAGVVSGARLAEDAGDTLEEIQNVFKQVVNLTQRISEASQQQVSSATNISDTMNVIQEITKQTSDGTTQTARSIGRLADLADDLQKSVSGFRLPT